MTTIGGKPKEAYCSMTRKAAIHVAEHLDSNALHFARRRAPCPLPLRLTSYATDVGERLARLFNEVYNAMRLRSALATDRQ